MERVDIQLSMFEGEDIPVDELELIELIEEGREEVEEVLVELPGQLNMFVEEI